MDSELISGFVARIYGWEPAALEPIHLDAAAGRALWRVEAPSGQSWMLRLRRAGTPVEECFGGLDSTSWLAERAAVLEWLAGLGYPAPLAARTRAQDLVGSHAGWSAVLTSFIPGERLAGGRQLGGLGAALGRLHAASAGAAPPISSWWHPLGRALADTRRRLDLAAAAPERWRGLAAECAAELDRSGRLADLPAACIHGDCWMGNAVSDETGAVTLIDWDAAGSGVALLDLGAILGDCFSRSADGVRPEPAWVAAVIDGYAGQRRLSAAEVAGLPAAIRFGAVFRSGLRFAAGREGGWDPGFDRGLAREMARLSASAAIIELAMRHLSFRPGADSPAG
ncbi:MAG TPA: phosphotransferase [Herpetosiphonaceae bacterium]|nr:phosphotransferase [Herpetosiphonaceae bacterium]